MNILQVVPNLGTGGAESFTIELTKELCRQGHKCDVLTLYDDKYDMRYKLMNHTKVSSLQKKGGFDIKCYFKLYNVIKEGNYDAVHAHVNAIPYLIVACLLLKNVQFVATIHSDAKYEAGVWINKWIRFILFKCNLCTPVAISDESLISLNKFYGINAPLVYNGLSEYFSTAVSSLKDNPEQTLFIHPASCQEVKNQRLLFRAFAKLAQDYPNIKLIWLGNNSSFSELFNDLQKEMVEQVQYLGVVSNVRDYLYQADAMCLSSKIEGMPMSIIEAFSVGCPPICTPVGGIKDMIIHNVNGILSKELSVDSYYEALTAFMQQSETQRNDMKKEARLSFARYDIKHCADEYLKVYLNTK